MKTLRAGIAGYADMKARTMAIARGEYRPRQDEPKVWFTSLESFARILSDRNRALLKLIAEEEPESLAELSGRAKSNLSRTLRALERYGLVHLERDDRGRIAPRVVCSDVVLNVPIGVAGGKDSVPRVPA